MTIDELRQRLHAEEESLKGKNGMTCLFSETGPVSLGLVKALADLVEAQGRELAEMKRELFGDGPPDAWRSKTTGGL